MVAGTAATLNPSTSGLSDRHETVNWPDALETTESIVGLTIEACTGPG